VTFPSDELTSVILNMLASLFTPAADHNGKGDARPRGKRSGFVLSLIVEELEGSDASKHPAGATIFHRGGRFRGHEISKAVIFRGGMLD
jgi:hypothetical protein